MDVINRKEAPAINEIKKAELIQASEIRLKNNIPVYYVNAGTQDLVKIEIIFPAGMWQQTAPLVGSAASAMLQEGTSKKTGKTIAEAIDFYGAFLHTEITHDFSTVGIHCLNKYLPDVLPIVQEIITDSVFPQEEWDIYLQNKKQSFIINNEKVSFVSRKKFSELVFGNDHPYGHNVAKEDFDTVKREQAFHFYKRQYTANDAIVVASGNVTDATLKLMEKYFGGLSEGEGDSRAILSPSPARAGTDGRRDGEGLQVLVEKKDAIQSAIRMGKMLFTKPHEDYLGMLVLNTVFGGYFGSRLMANIREDKGYTYGIGSAVVSYSHAGYFTLSTEVGAEVTRDALKEVYFELDRIQTELIPDSELQLVRNYMLGTFLRSIDGPFALADRFKGIYFHGLGYDYYDRYMETIRSITPRQLRDLANKYLKKDELIELVVGKK